MMHSIYIHKQIFLRELLSNASDAIDKIRFLSLTDNSINQGGEEYGIGMSYQEVIDNIGTIAKSSIIDFDV